MIAFGILLLILGFITKIGILYTLGEVLLVIGVILWALGYFGRPVGGRKYWY